MLIIKCINFGYIILAPPTMLVKIRHCVQGTNKLFMIWVNIEFGDLTKYSCIN